MERLDDTTSATQSVVPPKAGKKVEILPGGSADGSACTFCIHEEDHTLGNTMRYIIMKNPEVEFCGYSAPHPSEPKIHLRVQMYDGKSAIGAVKKALDDLETIFLAIDNKYKADVEKGDYDTYEEQFLDLKQVRAGITTRQPVKTEGGQGDDDAQMETA